MFSRLRALLRVTAVRLSIIYTLIFGILAVGIVAYMTGATVRVVSQQFKDSIDTEVSTLGRIYRARGLRAVVLTIERRALAPGANLYVISDPSGEIVAGNVPRLPDYVMRRVGWTPRPFRYFRFDDEEGEDELHHAVARVMELPNGMRILIGRDIGETEGFRKAVGKAFMLAIGTMLLLGLLTWFFVGRRALKRIDSVSESSKRILSGDRSERLPIVGSGDEFDRLSESLNGMLDRIGKLDVGLKQMSDNIAHDLKTPITRLRNKADAALSLADRGEGTQEALEEIIGDCDQIVKTFDALLMISRVESGSKVAQRASLNASTLLSDVHELYEAVAEEQGASLVLETVDTDLELFGNRELLSQALSNLIDNALKYGTPENQNLEIAIGAKRVGKNVVLHVSDNGPGIAENERGEVTERFVRLEKSRNTTGNGLGLSLAKAVAEMHDGTLTLTDNKPGLRVSLTISPEGV